MAENTDYEAALVRLPPAYAQVLRLIDTGTAESEICRQLSIEPEGLELLLALARRKLDAAMAEH